MSAPIDLNAVRAEREEKRQQKQREADVRRERAEEAHLEWLAWHYTLHHYPWKNERDRQAWILVGAHRNSKR